MDALAAADAVHVVNGVVAVAYPFSGTLTPHRVELDGLPAVYAMCAIDPLLAAAVTAARGASGGLCVVAGDDQLRGGQREPGQLWGTGGGIGKPGMELSHRRDGIRVGAADPLLQDPGLVLQVLKARVARKIQRI